MTFCISKFLNNCELLIMTNVIFLPAFSRVGCHQEAKDAFVACHDWRLAICEAEKLQYSHDQMIEFARNLAGMNDEKL